MATRNVVFYDEQTGITATSDGFVVDPTREISIGMILTAGTPVNGAKLQVTLDDTSKVVDGSARWIDSPLGLHVATSGEKVARPVTAVRLAVTDGTWSMQVRQG